MRSRSSSRSRRKRPRRSESEASSGKASDDLSYSKKHRSSKKRTRDSSKEKRKHEKNRNVEDRRNERRHKRSESESRDRRGKSEERRRRNRQSKNERNKYEEGSHEKTGRTESKYDDYNNYREEQGNSDTYWNRYPKLKMSEEEHVIGTRYYGGSTSKTEKPSVTEAETSKAEEEPIKKPVVPKKNADPILSKTGGAYIPPAMLKMMQASITDKSSTEYQRIAWEALKKSIHGLINKVNTTNIDKIIRQLLKENIVRGRGLLCRSIIQAQALSPTFTHVYAALAALINSRFPNIGELLLKRLVVQFRRGFKRNDKQNCISAAKFIAHLVNQRVAHEILALEILTLLVETPTDDSIEVSIAFLKESGMKLTEVSKKGVDAIFEMLRHVMNENKVERRVQYMIDVMFQVRKDKFRDNEAIPEGLDLVEEEDQFTHLITLEDATDGEDILNVFKFDTDYIAHEEKYRELSKEMVGDSEESGSGEDDDDDEGNENDDDEDEDDENKGPEKQVIIDNTETNLVALRRTIYLTINSSLDFEECCHKLMRMQLKPGQESEVCAMVLDCCCEMRTYERFYGLLAQRLCQVNRAFIEPYENLFKETYSTVHRLKKGQCRNVAKLLAHLLFTDAISWDVLTCIRLNEQDTTSSGRIFIKILFLELTEHMGLAKLNARVKDVTMQDAFSGLFPRDNPSNTRFSINFFTSIGLGGLTDELREHLKTAVQAQQTFTPAGAIDIPSDDSSPSSESSSEVESSDDTSSSEEERRKRKSKSKKSKVKKEIRKEKPSHRKRRK